MYVNRKIKQNMIQSDTEEVKMCLWLWYCILLVWYFCVLQIFQIRACLVNIYKTEIIFITWPRIHMSLCSYLWKQYMNSSICNPALNSPLWMQQSLFHRPRVESYNWFDNIIKFTTFWSSTACVLYVERLAVNF